jgi:hypothetical protein
LLLLRLRQTSELRIALQRALLFGRRQLAVRAQPVAPANTVRRAGYGPPGSIGGSGTERLWRPRDVPVSLAVSGSRRRDARLRLRRWTRYFSLLLSSVVLRRAGAGLILCGRVWNLSPLLLHIP